MKSQKIISDFLGKVKDPFWRAKQNYIKYYDSLPIDEHSILLESEHGKKIDGNIFYLIEHLANDPIYANYKIYVSSWGRYIKAFKEKLNHHGISNVEIVLYVSDEYFKILASVKYLFNDTSFGPYFIKKKGQIYCNTWHGTPLKALGRKMSSENSTIGNIQKNFIDSDFLLFPNEHTRDCLINDYMVGDLTSATEVFCGYPRNSVFLNSERQQELSSAINPENKTIFVYMPTFRGSVSKGGTNKGNVYLQYFLYELDKRLRDNEILYVNLHPLATKSVNYKDFTHIQRFPQNFETYETLSIADCLITDYSSVFFDFAISKKKIVLFPYDAEDYLNDRGMYMELSDLPFPKVYDVQSLLSELRSGKNYDDTSFLKTYCAYDELDSAKKICNLVINQKESNVKFRKSAHSGKQTVFIYPGNLANNGITRSLKNLISKINLNERNYYLVYDQSIVNKTTSFFNEIPDNLYYLGITGDMNLTVWDRIARRLFKEKKISTQTYVNLCKKRIQQNILRCFGNIKIDYAIQFNGYDEEIIILWSILDAETVIFVHNDMIEEIKTRHNSRSDLLHYAYNAYNKVAIVTEDIQDSTAHLSGGNLDKISVVHNTIDNDGIIKKSSDEINLDNSIVYDNQDHFYSLLLSSKRKFINIGRFSPEKGQMRLVNAFSRYHMENPDTCLIIMGGVSTGKYFDDLVSQIKTLNLEEDVILLKNVSNPYPILKRCDYFILSSFYEGFGLVLAEADILGLPVASTDITGPRRFLQANNGTLVENSEDGVYKAFCILGNDEIKPMKIDYDQYNNTAIHEFESLFN